MLGSIFFFFNVCVRLWASEGQEFLTVLFTVVSVVLTPFLAYIGVQYILV